MVAIVVLSVGALAAVIFTNRSPLLGLDLQGGISVVLEPYVDGKPAEDVSDEQVEQAIAIIRSRIDTLGVSEPEISSQGNSTLIQLPGIDDQERALELVGRTAQLEFRPVLSSTPVVPPDPKREAELRKELKIPEGKSAADIQQEELDARGLDAAGQSTTPEQGATPEGPATTAASAATTAPPALSLIHI